MQFTDTYYRYMYVYIKQNDQPPYKFVKIILQIFWDFSGSPSIRSPTENSIASLVSAAAIVKAKSEIEGECHTSAGELHACTGV